MGKSGIRKDKGRHGAKPYLEKVEQKQ